MISWGTPLPCTPDEQVKRATRCAIEMPTARSELNEEFEAEDLGIAALAIRIGLHHVPMVVGNSGNAARSDSTAIGSMVNLASRIESFCEPNEVFMSGEVCDDLPQDALPRVGAFEPKGVGRKVNLYHLHASFIESDAVK